MRFKFNWIISFCLVAFISLFNFVSTAYSGIVCNYPTVAGHYSSSGVYKDSNYKNVAFASYPNPNAKNSAIYQIYYSNSDIILTTTANGNIAYNSTTSTLSGCITFDDSLFHEWSAANIHFGSDTVIYSIKGNVSFNSKPLAVGTADQTGNSPLSDSDILNFNWQGDGIKIYNLKPNMKVSGYMDNQMRWFDIEAYGQFTYQGSDCLFTWFNYKKMQTQILNSSCFTYGSLSRTAGNGFGVKNGDEGFKWISNTNQLKKGDIVRFRVVYQAPLLEKGTYDVTVGATLPTGVGDGNYWSDTVAGLQFLNQNSDYGLPMDTSGETANVIGDTPGNSTPTDSQSANPDTSGKGPLEILGMVCTSILDFFKSIVSVSTNLGNIMPALTTMFATMFAFFPSPIPQLITTATGIIIFVAVLKFLRG